MESRNDEPSSQQRNELLKQKLAEVYQERLRDIERMARSALRDGRRSEGNYEDIVQSALRTGIKHIESPDPDEKFIPDPDDIWPYLRKHVYRKMDKYRAQYRNMGNKVLREGDLTNDDQVEAFREQFIDRPVSPEEMDEFVETALSILDEYVDNGQLREIVRLKMLGFSQNEIAERIGKTRGTVRRALNDAAARLSQDYGE